jgi:uncharacterized protein (DUF3084 family)
MKKMNLDVDIKRKATVRVSRKDLQKLLAENEQMAEQITALQTRMNELLEENRSLKAEKPAPVPEVEPKELSKEDIEELLKPQERTRPSYPSFRRDVYFDGSNNR